MVDWNKKERKWRGVDLNHRPVGYEPNALSTELPRQIMKIGKMILDEKKRISK
jgi:hypothetical protein